MADGLLATLDPESVADERPTALVTTPRAVFGFHLLVALVLGGLGATLAVQGSVASAGIVGGIAGMVSVAGWAAGRIVARR
jgi:hypothetical protein